MTAQQRALAPCDFVEGGRRLFTVRLKKLLRLIGNLT